MKRGFTLVEMLVVVVVIAALTTIVFRLAGIGRDVTARSVTVARLQRVENALSGYYAAFGVYPPVPLQGSRDIYRKVDGYHSTVQLDDREEDGGDLNYSRVEAACRSQPFGAMFPFAASRSAYVKNTSDMVKELINKKIITVKDEMKKAALLAGYDDGVTSNPGQFTTERSNWWGDNSVQLWRYGVMSFLLPRYMFMMQQSTSFKVEEYAQWREYNELPFDPETGVLYGNGDESSGWEKVRADYAVTGSKVNRWKVETIPSQAACMRWMPNFEGVCAANFQWTFWGVQIKGGLETDSGTIHVYNPAAMELYSQQRETTSQQYILDVITVRDGWGTELYYYSPTPHQSYRVWSAGSNKRTFAPWVDLKSLKSDARNKALSWTADDIAAMKN